MNELRPPRRQVILAAVLLAALLLLSLTSALAQPQQFFYGYARVLLPLVIRSNTQAVPPPVVPQPRIVAWLDIPGQVRINDRMQIIVNIQNQGGTDFAGRTEVILPYNGRKVYAAESSFDSSRGDWVKANTFPTDLSVEFGPLRSGELRRGVIYYDFHANSANAQVGDKLRIRARYSNGIPACGQDVCPTNERFVEVTDQFTSGGIGTLPPGSRQVQKLGDFTYGEQRHWTPEGFRPSEQVGTWLNTPSGGQQPLTLQQRADSAGKVYFSIDLTGLSNGFYSIVAHGNDSKTEIVGEFRVVNSPILSSAPLTRLALTALPAPTGPPEAGAVAQLAAAPAQSAGQTTLTGVVAAADSTGATRLAGVLVSVVAADGSVLGTAVTDGFGGYVINSLSAGAVSIHYDPSSALDATVRRYQPQTKALSLPASGVAQLDADLVPGAAVGGIVTGASAGGLPGVSVLLLSGDAVLGATTSGDDGHYQIEGVPSGSYTLQFDPATSADPAVRAFDRATLAAFAVSAPAPRSGKDIILSRSTATVELAGQVVAADTGRPLNAVFVVFERLNPTTSAYEYAGLALSDTSGDYSGVLPPGTYRLAFRPGFSSDPDSARYLGEYFDDIAAGPTGATEITLAGGAIARADAALAPGGTIAGTVTGDDLPLAGAVTLISDAASGRLVAIALTDANGAYRSSGLPAGSYRLEFATYLADDPTTQTYAGTARAQPVALSSTASVTGIDARLSKGGTIAGTVTGTGGAPLANVLVLVLDTLGTPDSSDDELRGLALTNASGAYATSGMPTGSYVVSFSTALTGGPDVAAYFGEYSNDAATLADADPVSVVAGVQTANINANLRQGGQLRGRVTAAVGGFGLAGVLVEVYTVSDPTALVAFAITDERGDYATTALTTGSSYLVRFDPSFGGGLSLYTPEYYTDAASAAAAQAVSVPTTAPITGIDAELAALP